MVRTNCPRLTRCRADSSDLCGATEAFEQQRRERALRAAIDEERHLEALGRLAGGIAHDFNNLLATVRLQAEQIGETSDERGRRSAEAIGLAVGRAGALVAQLVAFARRDAGTPIDLDLGSCVRAVEPLILASAGPAVSVRFDLTSDPCVVHADPSQIDQVILNLVCNARDAMPDGGELVIATSVEPLDDPAEPLPLPHATLRVVDTGTGMSPADRARVFEPFFSTKGAGGTGLGLAIVHSIVGGLGGRASVESAPGEGATFTMSLPMASVASSHGAAVVDLADDPLPWFEQAQR